MSDEDPNQVSPISQVLYDEAVRAVEQGLASIDAVQTRAALILAALTITASELGRRALDRPGNPLPGSLVVGWIALAACVGATTFVMWPRNLRGSVKVERLPALPADHLVQTLAHNYAGARARNGATIDRMWLALRIAIVTLAVSAAAWAAILIWR